MDATLFFAQAGKRVVATCMNEAERTRLVDSAQKAGLTERVQPVIADLADEAAVRRLVEQAGPVDAAFNAAGGFRWALTTEMDARDFDFLVAANFKSSWLLAKHLVPGMRERGFGRLVFVSARASLGLGEAGMGVYTATKAALNALVLGLAAELRGTGVNINAVLPTVIDSPANRAAMPQANPADWVSRESLIRLVAELLGPVGEPLNGALLPVAGRL